MPRKKGAPMNPQRKAVLAYKLREAATTVSLLVAFVLPVLAASMYGYVLLLILIKGGGGSVSSPAQFFEILGRLNEGIGKLIWTSPWGWVVLLPICAYIVHARLEKAQKRAREEIMLEVTFVPDDQLDEIEKGFQDSTYGSVVMLERWRRREQQEASPRRDVE